MGISGCSRLEFGNSQARVAWRIGADGMENWNEVVYSQAEASTYVSNCCLESGNPRLGSGVRIGTRWSIRRLRPVNKSIFAVSNPELPG